MQQLFNFLTAGFGVFWKYGPQMVICFQFNWAFSTTGATDNALQPISIKNVIVAGLKLTNAVAIIKKANSYENEDLEESDQVKYGVEN